MNPIHPNSIEDFQLRNGYDAIRKTLAEPRFQDRHHRTLASWAQPGDRRLPLAFLGRTIAEMVATSFEEVAATAGVGRKKIASLIGLLHRVAVEVPRPESSITPPKESARPKESKRKGKKGSSHEAADPPSEAPASGAHAGGEVVAAAEEEKFDPADVTDSNWDIWRRLLEASALSHEPLGRLAPTLQLLPRHLWHKQIGEFSPLSLEELRQATGKNEQDILGIARVFSAAAWRLRGARDSSIFAVQLCPKFVVGILAWLQRGTEGQTPPSAEAIESGLAQPLLDQMRIDGGDELASAAAKWIRQWKPEWNQAPQGKGNEIRQAVAPCARIMAVRWLEGRFFLARLAARMQEWPCEAEAVRLLEAICEAFYPDRIEG